MLKQLFRFKMDGAEPEVDVRNGTVEEAVAVAAAEPLPRRYWEKTTAEEPPEEPKPAAPAAVNGHPSFDEIYRGGATGVPRVTYDIRKVAEMMESPHLAGMSPDARRNSVLLALEAVGVQINDLIQDAMDRLRALNAYEETQNRDLKDFEEAKARENTSIKAELDRLSASHMVRIQANLDQVARREDNFRRWTQLKQQEAEQIVETAMFCAPPANGSGLSALTGAYARVAAEAAAGKR